MCINNENIIINININDINIINNNNVLIIMIVLMCENNV